MGNVCLFEILILLILLIRVAHFIQLQLVHSHALPHYLKCNIFCYCIGRKLLTVINLMDMSLIDQCPVFGDVYLEERLSLVLMLLLAIMASIGYLAGYYTV